MRELKINTKRLYSNQKDHYLINFVTGFLQRIATATYLHHPFSTKQSPPSKISTRTPVKLSQLPSLIDQSQSHLIIGSD
jgi:hypothetical protein